MFGSKKWYMSKSILGNIVAGVSLGIGYLKGTSIDAATQALVVDQVVGTVSAVSGLAGILISVYGRLTATQIIK